MNFHISIRSNSHVSRTDEPLAIFLPCDHWLPEPSHGAPEDDGGFGEKVGVPANNEVQLSLFPCLDEDFLLSHDQRGLLVRWPLVS